MGMDCRGTPSDPFPERKKLHMRPDLHKKREALLQGGETFLYKGTLMKPRCVPRTLDMPSARPILMLESGLVSSFSLSCFLSSPF